MIKLMAGVLAGAALAIGAAPAVFAEGPSTRERVCGSFVTPEPPDGTISHSICFDGKGGLLTGESYINPTIVEGADGGGRYWGSRGRIYLSGEGRGWLWEWQELACDLTETPTTLEFRNCEGVTPQEPREAPEKPADLLFERGEW